MIKNIIKDIVAFFYYNSFKRFSNHIGNRTLIYHAFGMKLSHDTYGMSIPIDKFREHMMFIKENFQKTKGNYSRRIIGKLLMQHNLLIILLHLYVIHLYGFL